MNIVVIGAHNDDYICGMCGTILRHIEDGDEVYGIIATDSSGLGDPIIRKKDAIKIDKACGMKSTTFLGFKDTMLKADGKTIKAIEKVLDKVQPEVVYVHSIQDTHQDHRNLAYATLTAARKIPTIIFYETPSSQIGFNPHYYIDITKYINKKISLLKLFQGGVEFKWYMEIESILGTAVFRGYQSNTRYAEAFELFRVIKRAE